MNYFFSERIIKLISQLINKYQLIWQFIKFCLVGFTNLAIYLTIYWLITRLLHWHYLPASIVGFLIAVTWSFTINLNWTFKHKDGDRRRQYIKFIIANLISMCINLALLTVFIEAFQIYDLLAQFIVAVIVAFFNFTINRFWTFKK